MVEEHDSIEPAPEDETLSSEQTDVPSEAIDEKQNTSVGTPMEIAKRLTDVRELIRNLQDRERELGHALRTASEGGAAPSDHGQEIPEQVIDVIRERTPGMVLPAVIDFVEKMVDERINFYAVKAGQSPEEYLQCKFENVDIQRSLVTAISEHYIKELLSQQAVTFEYQKIAQIVGNAFNESEVIGLTRKTNESMQKAVFDIIHTFVHDSVFEFAQQQSISVDECCVQFLGFDCFESLTEDVIPKIWHELIERMSGDSDTILVDAAALRHNVVNQLNVHRGRKSYLDHYGEEIDLTEAQGSKNESEGDPLDASIREHIAQLLEERKVSRMGMKYHEHLKGIEAEMIKAVTPRIAGYDHEGNRIDIEADIQLYRTIESKFTNWKQKVVDGAASYDQHMIMAGLIDFHQHGGHASVFSDEQVRFIIENGLIVFLEMEMKNGARATVGTVSSLSHTPYNYQIQSKEDAWHLLATKFFPQYDFRDLTIPYDDATKQRQKESAKRTIQICRSSILPALTDEFLTDVTEEQIPDAWRGKSLRRLGLAALGKYVTFKVGQKFGSEHVTFNIGTVKTPEDDGLQMNNKVSREHNSWISSVSWKNTTTPLAGGVLMYWNVYKGEIARGMEEFARPGGILSGKGWDLENVDNQCEEICVHISEDIAVGRHAPW